MLDMLVISMIFMDMLDMLVYVYLTDNNHDNYDIYIYKYKYIKWIIYRYPVYFLIVNLYLYIYMDDLILPHRMI